jgi:hypothetical protein
MAIDGNIAAKSTRVSRLTRCSNGIDVVFGSNANARFDR